MEPGVKKSQTKKHHLADNWCHAALIEEHICKSLEEHIGHDHLVIWSPASISVGSRCSHKIVPNITGFFDCYYLFLVFFVFVLFFLQCENES